MPPSAPLPRPGPLRCPVRGCGLALAAAGLAWRCGAGHAFDVARGGALNLLQPQDRRAREPGDPKEAVEARFRLAERGVGDEVAEALASAAAALVLDASGGGAALEVGAGTGANLARVVRATGLEGWAVELSARAAHRGARLRPELRWIVANADRTLPFFDHGFVLVLSVLGPKHAPELHRVLDPGGALLLALPAPDDLVELRAAVQGEGRRVDRVAPALARFEPWFRCVARESVRARRRLGPEELRDVLATTYRGARAAERERAARLAELEVTFAVELLRLAPLERPDQSTASSAPLR